MSITKVAVAVAANGGYDRPQELQAFDDTKAGVKGLVDSGTKSIPAIFHHCTHRIPYRRRRSHPPPPPLTKRQRSR
jgi:hypothetical protein